MLHLQAFPFENKTPNLIPSYPKGNKHYSANPAKLHIQRINSTTRVGWERSMTKPLPVLPALPARTRKRLQATLKEKRTT